MATNDEPELDIGLMSAVRVAALRGGKRVSAIRSTLRGGAIHPWATLFALAFQYLAGVKPRTLFRPVNHMRDLAKRRHTRRCLKNLMRMFPEINWKATRPQRSPAHLSVNGSVRVRTEPHVVLEYGSLSRHIAFWANKTADVAPATAELAAAMMREAANTERFTSSTFEVVDMITCTHYSFDVRDLDEHPSPMPSFLREVEEALRAAKAA